MAVGDVNSDARGSGARYNDGKVPLHLIPLTIIADSFDEKLCSDVQHDAQGALGALGWFQTTGDVRDGLDVALNELASYWTAAARVFDYGRKKYAEWNWAKGMAWSIPLACAARHALAILEGEETDPESGLPHVGHLLCNLVMLRTFVTTYPEGNDLPPAHLFDDRRPVIGGYRAEEHHAVEAPMPPTVDFVVHTVNPVGGDFTVDPVGGDFTAPSAGPHSFKVGDRVVANGYFFGPQSGVIAYHYYADCWAVLFDERPDDIHARTDSGGKGWTYFSNELTPLLESTDVPLIQN